MKVNVLYLYRPSMTTFFLIIYMIENAVVMSHNLLNFFTVF